MSDLFDSDEEATTEQLIYLEEDSIKAIKRYNIEEPNLEERLKLYLKQIDANPALQMLLLLVDTISGIIFVVFQV